MNFSGWREPKAKSLRHNDMELNSVRYYTAGFRFSVALANGQTGKSTKGVMLWRLAKRY
jgi:hypothetical protein